MNDDLISRKALWESLQDVLPYQFCSLFIAAKIKEIIERAPAVDPHKHGRWERCFEDWRRQIEGSKCTACGFEHYGSCINYYHYCPNCGTRMDGGEEQ